MPLSLLAAGKPVPFKQLGEDIVLFLGADGQPAALKDRCCHRTAKLSKGCCVNGALQCGYHGWTYNTASRVIRIPQYDPERTIRRLLHAGLPLRGQIRLCLGGAGGHR